MKTKAVPAMIMLTAGLIDCIFSIYCHLPLLRFTWQLLVVLLIFYVLGCVVQLVLDKNFAEMEQTDENQEESKETDGEEQQEAEDGQEASQENPKQDDAGV